MQDLLDLPPIPFLGHVDHVKPCYANTPNQGGSLLNDLQFLVYFFLGIL